MIFKDRTIEKRVMGMVKGWIDEAQKEHEVAVLQAEEEHEKEIEAAKINHKARLSGMQDLAVAKVFGKMKAS